MANETRIPSTSQPLGPNDDAERSARYIAPTMLREGDYWTILFRGRLVRVRHNKGVGYLAELVARPWQSVHVSALYGAPRSAEPGPARPIESDRKAVGSRIRAALGHIRDSDAALGDHLKATVTTGSYCSYAPRREGPPK